MKCFMRHHLESYKLVNNYFLLLLPKDEINIYYCLEKDLMCVEEKA
jgi:hypothetical protein